MLPGTARRAALHAAWQRSARIPCNGGFTFAEAPTVAWSEARIIWRAELDPETLSVDAIPIPPGDPDEIDAAKLRPFLAIARDVAGHEHVVLSDGSHRIRLDVEHGSLADNAPITVRYHLIGIASAWTKTGTLIRFLDLCRSGRFSRSLFPHEHRIDRWVVLLRVHDALRAGASQREIAEVLFGDERFAREWHDASDSLRSRIRRLVRDARRMAAGGYRSLLHDRARISAAKRRQVSEKPSRSD
jgi:hypothetical protein